MNVPSNDDMFDFDKYRTEDNVKSSPHPEMKSNEEPFDFNKFLPKEPPSAFEEFGRHIARTGSRVGETIVGFPGDIVGFSKFLAEKAPKVPSFLEREPNLIQQYGKKALEKLPSSQELKEFTSYLTSGFTDPQGAKEELGDDITSLATSLLIPSKDPLKFKSLIGAIGTSAFAKSSKEGAKLLGAGPTGQSIAEIGSLFLTGLLNKNTADKFIGDQFKSARSKIPPNTMIPTQRLEKSLISLEEELAKGISTGTKNEVKNAVQELRAKASGGAMEADELVESFHNINERYTSKKLFDELSTSERKNLKHRYDKYKNEVGKEIADYGKENPEFYKQWKEANNGFAIIAQSKKVSNFLQSKLGSLPKHLAGTVAIELFLGHPNVAVGTVLGAGAVKTGELLYRIAKSPKLREHYLSVISEASKENLPAVIKNLEALQKESKDLDKD